MTVIVDLIARGIPLAFAGVLLAGCASTTHFSSEYSRDYHLIRDVHVRQCEMFIGGWSLWFGPDRVACIQSLHDGRESASDVVFRQDSLVRVKRLFRIAAIDANYDSAELILKDRTTGIEMHVYLENWPDHEAFFH